MFKIKYIKKELPFYKYRNLEFNIKNDNDKVYSVHKCFDGNKYWLGGKDKPLTATEHYSIYSELDIYAQIQSEHWKVITM